MKRLFCLILILSLVTVTGCGKPNKAEEHNEEKSHEQHSDEHGDEHAESGTVHLKEESQKLIGLELIQVRKEPLQSIIEVVGEIAQETENVSHVTSPEPGILKSIQVSIGQEVEPGDPICQVVTKTGKTIEIKCPSHGIVLAQYAKEKDSIDNLTSIMTIADPDLLRASFSIYEKDLAGIQIGQKVKVYSIAYPEKEFEGEIVFISPQVDEKTRTIKIRVDVKNEEHLLKFGMFVTGKIIIPLSEEALVIPQIAVQVVQGKSVVFVPSPEEPDKFIIKEVKLGRKTNKIVEVKEGLQEGEKIAGKGSFYLKSELLKGELEEGHAH